MLVPHVGVEVIILQLIQSLVTETPLSLNQPLSVIAYLALSLYHETTTSYSHAQFEQSTTRQPLAAHSQDCLNANTPLSNDYACPNMHP